LSASGKDRRNLLWNCAVGAMLTVGVGIVALQSDVFSGLVRLSYDLPLVLQNQVPSDIVVVYIDGKVKANLGEPVDPPLDRRYHARLVDRLTKEGARLVFYDLLFDTASADGEADKAFGEALRGNGKVVLVADYIKSLQGYALLDSPLPPIAPLQTAAAGWGLAALEHDADFAVRRIGSGSEEFPSAGWVGASLLGAEVTRSPDLRLVPRWLNYYCAPQHLPAVNFDHALDGAPAGHFRNKIVVVGSRPSPGGGGAAREEFASPFSRFGRRFSSGAEVHAFTILNLLRGDWLRQLNSRGELLLVIVIGSVLGAGLFCFRPWTSMIIAAGVVLLIFASEFFLQVRHHLWWSWAVPVCVQTPVAVLWAVGWRYLVESRKRRRLRQAFSVYLSPYLADRIAQSDFDLSLGGQQVEATVLFTDIAGFTAMSEKLPPQEVSMILTTYFTRTTRHILESDGTIIKYMGDAIMAVWGAPLANAQHARDAVLAACKVIEEGKTEIAGRRLRTRIGINTGLVLAGNLGSEFRFDYTTIGATTNLASRLEGLNKLLGTEVLIAEATRERLPKEIEVRNLGRFILSGTTEPVGVYEVLGPSSERPNWAEVFDEAVEHWSRREFKVAASLMQKVIALRGGNDGPSEFYLTQLDLHQAALDNLPVAIKIDTK
jgi:adenylate cyclase